MKFLIAVFLPASPFIPTSPFINFGDFCQPPHLLHPPHLLFWLKFASLPFYSPSPSISNSRVYRISLSGQIKTSIWKLIFLFAVQLTITPLLIITVLTMTDSHKKLLANLQELKHSELSEYLNKTWGIVAKALYSFPWRGLCPRTLSNNATCFFLQVRWSLHFQILPLMPKIGHWRKIPKVTFKS